MGDDDVFCFMPGCKARLGTWRDRDALILVNGVALATATRMIGLGCPRCGAWQVIPAPPTRTIADQQDDELTAASAAVVAAERQLTKAEAEADRAEAALLAAMDALVAARDRLKVAVALAGPITSHEVH